MIKRILVSALLLAGLLVPAPLVLADGVVGSGSKSTGCDALSQLDGGQSCASDASTKAVDSIFTSVTELISWAVGIAAIIMIFVAGFKYMTSGGDANKVGSAKTTLIYALIGLLVATLAQVLVKTVLKHL